MSNSFPNVIFLFLEGMLTSREQSAILLHEECLGQTERSPGTIVVKPLTAPLLLQLSQEETGPSWGPTASCGASRTALGRVASVSATAPAERDAGMHIGITQSHAIAQMCPAAGAAGTCYFVEVGLRNTQPYSGSSQGRQDVGFC